ncbi:MAG: glycosyltransferase [Bacteroidota bacterium]|nr:glycosyltransferase [Bacteroidota bacterium]
MKVSIIIPTKNRWHLLKETLANILNQSLTPYEVIVVDDGSTDKTEEGIKFGFKDKVIYTHNGGKGPGAARNTGMEIATGDYIKFFDSDDLMTRNTLEAQVKAFQNNHNTFIYSSYFQAKSKDGMWETMDDTILQYYPFPDSQPLNYWMCRGLFLPIPGMLFKKELLKDTGKWRTDITAYEDFDYLWRLSLMVPYPKHINDCAFLYRTHGRQITEHDFTHEQRDKDKVLIFEKIIDSYFPDYLNSNDLKTLYLKIAFLPNQNRRNFNKYDLYILKKKNQLKDKIGRLNTKSSWQPFTGPYQSKSKIEDYMKKIL